MEVSLLYQINLYLTQSADTGCIDQANFDWLYYIFSNVLALALDKKLESDGYV